jgi:phenylpyruvate tautomerase PptA (4-oxalocrotonate tautomerase family)
MPLYEVEHITPLTGDQKDLLASAITTIHSQLFTTPSLFVNVRFTNVVGDDTYIGGKRVCHSLILDPLLFSKSPTTGFLSWRWSDKCLEICK